MPPARRRTLLIASALVIGVTALLAGYAVQLQTWDTGAEGSAKAAVPGSVSKPERGSPPDLAPRPAFELPDIDGVSRRVSEWDGRLLVINFWATWCPPCLEEIPMFVELQRDYASTGLQFIGIAIDEPQNVRRFVAESGMNYPTLHGQLEAIDISRRYGNRSGGLPYTVIVDPSGRIVFAHAGAIRRPQIEAAIRANL